MNQLQAYAAARLGSLAEEPLFRTLAADPAPGRSLQMLGHLTFWSSTFQDITLLNLARVRDPRLREIVSTHQGEDAGHEQWFIDDLLLVFGKLPDVVAVFDPVYRPAREVCFELMSEVFHCESDWERVALPIALEEGGKVFLPRMIDHFERVGLASALSALGTRHAQSEALHALHSDDTATVLGAFEMPMAARARSNAMVDRVTGTFKRFAAILETAIRDCSPAAEAQIARRIGRVLSRSELIETTRHESTES